MGEWEHIGEQEQQPEGSKYYTGVKFFKELIISHRRPGNMNLWSVELKACSPETNSAVLKGIHSDQWSWLIFPVVSFVTNGTILTS